MLTAIIMLRAQPAWLRLTRAVTGGRQGEQHFGAVRSLTPTSRLATSTRAFTTRCSDVLLIEAPSMREYTFFIDSLRYTPLIADEYFSFVEIIPMIEDSYDDDEVAHPDTIGGASSWPTRS